jgi:ubiquinone/menaquinone biosynthesis C-methylase UbiE
VSALEGFFPATSMPDSDWWNALWPRPGEVFERLGLAKEAEVIDLCCGDGLFTIPLARMVRHVAAIDLDPAMLALARDRALAEGLTNCTFTAGNAYDLAKLVPSRVDWVLIANTFHGVPDKTRLACAVAAVLRPGGRFAVINWHRRPRAETTVMGQPRGPKTEMRMTPGEVTAAVAQAGLRPLPVIDVPPYHYAAISERLPDCCPG